MVKIQQAALEEFSDKGFFGASLRQIVKNAGVTTGAFYGYFSSKEALFASIVEPHATALMGRFMEAQIGFAELPEEEQPRHMGEASGDYVNWMVDYIYRHFDIAKYDPDIFTTACKHSRRLFLISCQCINLNLTLMQLIIPVKRKYNLRTDQPGSSCNKHRFPF